MSKVTILEILKIYYKLNGAFFEFFLCIGKGQPNFLPNKGHNLTTLLKMVSIFFYTLLTKKIYHTFQEKVRKTCSSNHQELNISLAVQEKP